VDSYPSYNVLLDHISKGHTDVMLVRNMVCSLQLVQPAKVFVQQDIY